jgi:hypothetical protein
MAHDSRVYTAEDIQNMSFSEYAGLRNIIYAQTYGILWSRESYDYYLSMYVETGDEIYLERMLEKVEIND